MPDRPDRLATQLLRIARDPATGRLHHHVPLATGLRAALFTDLILSGRVSEYGGAPRADEPAEPGDRILDAVQRTVAQRAGVAWWRWFRHVRTDRVALVDELVEAKRWTPRGGVRASYDDIDHHEALALSIDVQRVMDGLAEPADSRQAVLAVLSLMCGSLGGRPHPRAVRQFGGGRRRGRSRDDGAALLRRSLHPLVDAAADTGEPGAEVLPNMLIGASRMLKKPVRRGG